MSGWRDFLDPGDAPGALLPWREVEPRVGISRTTAWRLQKLDDFPRPCVVSPGRVAYREAEVEAWRRSRQPRATSAPPNVQTRPASPGPEKPPPSPAPPARIAPRPRRRRSRTARAARTGSGAEQITFDF